MPATKSPFCSFLHSDTGGCKIPIGYSNSCWAVNLVNSSEKSAMHKSVHQFLIGECIDN